MVRLPLQRAHVTRTLAFRLVDSGVFDSGAVVMRYATMVS